MYNYIPYLILLLIILGVFYILALWLRRIIRRNSMKKYAKSINAHFVKIEGGWLLNMFSWYQKYNIIIGEYNNQPLEVYHYRIAAFGANNLVSYCTSVNGKSYDGLLSTREINTILTGGDISKLNRSPSTSWRKFNPW